MFTFATKLLTGATLAVVSVQSALVVGGTNTSVQALEPTCGIVNKLKDGNSNRFSSLASDLLGFAQAGAVFFMIIGIVGLILFYFTKWRGKLATVVLGGFLVITFGPALIGFATSQNSGGCSFF